MFKAEVYLLGTRHNSIVPQKPRKFQQCMALERKSLSHKSFLRGTYRRDQVAFRRNTMTDRGSNCFPNHRVAACQHRSCSRSLRHTSLRKQFFFLLFIHIIIPNFQGIKWNFKNFFIQQIFKFLNLINLLHLLNLLFHSKNLLGMADIGLCFSILVGLKKFLLDIFEEICFLRGSSIRLGTQIHLTLNSKNQEGKVHKQVKE